MSFSIAVLPGDGVGAEVTAQAVKVMEAVGRRFGPDFDLTFGKVGGAAIDVSEVEPIESDNPLLQEPNCLVTPHIAGFSPTFLDECPRKQAENVINILTGIRPHGLANPEVIKTIAVMRSGDPGRWQGIPDFSTALDL